MGRAALGRHRVAGLPARPIPPSLGLEARVGQVLEELRQDEVVRLCRAGREHADVGDRAEALADYLAAWELLPEPKTSCDASTWILAAVGDLLRSGGDLANALDLLLTVRGRTAGATGA